MSADGRYVAFSSAATNLVPNDTNNASDIFVRDTLLSTTVRVSISSTGQESNGVCFTPAISASGNRVAFISSATNLAPIVPGVNQPYHIFVHDMQSGVTEVASVDDHGNTPGVNAGQVLLSADGRHVLFLVDMTGAGSTVAPWYVRDLQTQTSTLLVTNDSSVNFAPRYLDGMFLGDGRWVAFSRATSSPSGEPLSRILIVDRDSDQNGIFDEPGTIKRKTIEPSQGAHFVREASSSRNGRFLTYLAANFGVQHYELWLHDRDPDGDGIFDQPSSVPDSRVTLAFDYDGQATRVSQVSNDGRYVVFADQASAGGDSVRAALVRDMQTGGTFVQSVNPMTGDPAPIGGTPTISGDGSWTIAATAVALDAADGNALIDVYRIPHVEAVCEAPVYYGEPTSNSVYAFGANLRVVGSTSIGADNFTLSTQYVPNGPGQYFYGPDQVSTPFGDGLRLVGAGVSGLIRLPIIHGVGNFATYQMHFGVPPASAGAGHITPGSTWNFQYVFRDPTSGTFGFNTSNAVRVTFCP